DVLPDEAPLRDLGDDFRLLNHSSDSATNRIISWIYQNNDQSTAASRADLCVPGRDPELPARGRAAAAVAAGRERAYPRSRAPVRGATGAPDHAARVSHGGGGGVRRARQARAG